MADINQRVKHEVHFMPKGDNSKVLAFRRWLEGKSLKQIERECATLGTDPEKGSVKLWIREWERGRQRKWDVDISN